MRIWGQSWQTRLALSKAPRNQGRHSNAYAAPEHLGVCDSGPDTPKGRCGITAELTRDSYHTACLQIGIRLARTGLIGKLLGLRIALSSTGYEPGCSLDTKHHVVVTSVNARLRRSNKAATYTYRRLPRYLGVGYHTSTYTTI